MKITKNMLKQLIKEAWRTRRPPEYKEVLDPTMRARSKKKGRKELVAALKVHVTVWSPEEIDSLSEFPLDIWEDLLTKIIVHWGNVGARAFGCKHDPSTNECKIINKVLQNLRSDMKAIGRTRNKSWWIQKNYDNIISTLDYVPTSEKPGAVMDTPAWGATSGAGSADDNDL